MVRYRLLIVIAAVAVVGGCVELATLIGGAGATDGGSSSGGSFGGGGGAPPILDGGDTVPVVRLTVSNTVPQVSEEVILTCERVSGSTAGIVFAFQTTFDRLDAPQGQSEASFVVDQSDIGRELMFTCTATNEAGTSQPSASSSVFPT